MSIPIFIPTQTLYFTMNDLPQDERYALENDKDVQHMTSLGLRFNILTTTEGKIFYYERGIWDVMTERLPILVLLHGYPQTSFIDIPLFIPDVPGYGRSSPLSSGPHDKRSVGQAILKTLYILLSRSNNRSYKHLRLNHAVIKSIIIAGHDQGARICHRLAVDQAIYPCFSIRGAILVDMVPTAVQWSTFGMPERSTAWFHWPFLANVEVATELIMAQGGDAFVRMCLNRWVGNNDQGLAKFKSNDSIAIYADSFKYESVIRATCDEFRAGAEEDIQLQCEDQRAGRKVDVDVLLLCSESLFKEYNMGQVWREWMGKGTVQGGQFGGGIGHFIAEEAPEKAADLIRRFYIRCT
ncbi:Fluoroacetate dehalogenase [Lachnellula occidentalis]|uniref:Fluoroacetate dehalogenase n=1 Tax=Lachnellula occidentalis TaxID=215460 RepID=A0A8H8U606_9HELO|nr:Fluoroacetate dehalogenase [Lachnellula occidentalis]